MPAFYLTLIAVLLSGIGARDQVTVAGLSLRQGQRPGVLIVAVVSALLTAVFAAWAARVVLAELPPPARGIFAAFALGMAGLESVILTPRCDVREPTNSLGALFLVLLMHQITDAPRFLVFGMGVGLAGPVPAGLAGILGGTGLVVFAWSRPALMDTATARWTRRAVGGLLVVAALALGLSEIGIV